MAELAFKTDAGSRCTQGYFIVEPGVWRIDSGNNPF